MMAKATAAAVFWSIHSRRAETQPGVARPGLFLRALEAAVLLRAEDERMVFSGVGVVPGESSLGDVSGLADVGAEAGRGFGGRGVCGIGESGSTGAKASSKTAPHFPQSHACASRGAPQLGQTGVSCCSFTPTSVLGLLAFRTRGSTGGLRPPGKTRRLDSASACRGSSSVRQMLQGRELAQVAGRSGSSEDKIIHRRVRAFTPWRGIALNRCPVSIGRTNETLRSSRNPRSQASQ